VVYKKLKPDNPDQEEETVQGDIDISGSDVLTDVYVESIRLDGEGDCVVGLRVAGVPDSAKLSGYLMSWRLRRCMRRWKNNGTVLQMQREQVEGETVSLSLWSAVDESDRIDDALESAETLVCSLRDLCHTAGQALIHDRLRGITNRWLASGEKDPRGSRRNRSA
jgi:hypothetical protein